MLEKLKEPLIKELVNMLISNIHLNECDGTKYLLSLNHSTSSLLKDNNSNNDMGIRFLKIELVQNN